MLLHLICIHPCEYHVSQVFYLHYLFLKYQLILCIWAHFFSALISNSLVIICSPNDIFFILSLSHITSRLMQFGNCPFISLIQHSFICFHQNTPVSSNIFILFLKVSICYFNLSYFLHSVLKNPKYLKFSTSLILLSQIWNSHFV